MEKSVARYNEQAISIKKWLGSDAVKSQIMAAAPKILNGERFLKVFYGAILRNPKLSDCTTESLLQAAMFFAQLGLEPILGRAYLVPYLNTKQIEGRWVKQYEVQAQIGYQGLVDLARRSGTISDVWGACVYENDLFDMTYGMERNLIHKPWFMDPEKRRAGHAGELVGAYVIWKLKDETKHPEFLPAFEIYKRRAKSQSYTWAETGDPAKGGGKKDSVWHQWPDDMALKTVIKHSAKLVPASIEFMQAVEADDSGFIGHTQSFQSVEPPKLSAPTFDEMAQARLPTWPSRQWEDFLVETAAKQKPPLQPAEFKAAVESEGNFSELWEAYERWQRRLPDGNGSPAWERKKWIMLRGAGYGKYIKEHLEAFRSAPNEILLEARGKWISIYRNSEPWPLDAPKPQQQEASAPNEKLLPEDHELQEVALLLQRLDALAAIEDGIFVMQAQKDLGYPVGLQYLDDLRASAGLDMIRELVDTTERVMENAGNPSA